jgi:hypothetical protein
LTRRRKGGKVRADARKKGEGRTAGLRRRTERRRRRRR